MAGSPLLGYNTNVRHLGKLYHIQTEDSGASHGHIFTHLFADGGRIIASKKTTYSQYIGTAEYPGVVKQLMRESHKAMFIALRDGLFDEDEAAGARAMMEMEITLDGATPPKKPATPTPSAEIDVDALERAAEAKLAEAAEKQTPSQAPAARQSTRPQTDSGRYAPTRPAVASGGSHRPAARPPDPASESIFGSDLLSEKSLDEVILSYLAEDVDDEG
ncbi:MAG: hypothetical protein VYE22_10645 [Myxococcota bacterium]|nr:hypothetical protein [Myxococcota bacterium]